MPSSSAHDDAHDDAGADWTHMPPEVLHLVAASLSLEAVKAARISCRYWATSLSPCIRHVAWKLKSDQVKSEDGARHCLQNTFAKCTRFSITPPTLIDAVWQAHPLLLPRAVEVVGECPKPGAQMLIGPDLLDLVAPSISLQLSLSPAGPVLRAPDLLLNWPWLHSISDVHFSPSRLSVAWDRPSPSLRQAPDVGLGPTLCLTWRALHSISLHCHFSPVQAPDVGLGPTLLSDLAWLHSISLHCHFSPVQAPDVKKVLGTPIREQFPSLANRLTDLCIDGAHLWSNSAQPQDILLMSSALKGPMCHHPSFAAAVSHWQHLPCLTQLEIEITSCAHVHSDIDDTALYLDPSLWESAVWTGVLPLLKGLTCLQLRTDSMAQVLWDDLASMSCLTKLSVLHSAWSLDYAIHAERLQLHRLVELDLWDANLSALAHGLPCLRRLRLELKGMDYHQPAVATAGAGLPDLMNQLVSYASAAGIGSRGIASQEGGLSGLAPLRKLEEFECVSKYAALSDHAIMELAQAWRHLRVFSWKGPTQVSSGIGFSHFHSLELLRLRSHDAKAASPNTSLQLDIARAMPRQVCIDGADTEHGGDDTEQFGELQGSLCNLRYNPCNLPYSLCNLRYLAIRHCQLEVELLPLLSTSLLHLEIQECTIWHLGLPRTQMAADAKKDIASMKDVVSKNYVGLTGGQGSRETQGEGSSEARGKRSSKTGGQGSSEIGGKGASEGGGQGSSQAGGQESSETRGQGTSEEGGEGSSAAGGQGTSERGGKGSSQTGGEGSRAAGGQESSKAGNPIPTLQTPLLQVAHACPQLRSLTLVKGVAAHLQAFRDSDLQGLVQTLGPTLEELRLGVHNISKECFESTFHPACLPSLTNLNLSVGNREVAAHLTCLTSLTALNSLVLLVSVGTSYGPASYGSSIFRENLIKHLQAGLPDTPLSVLLQP
eukprot:gene25100-10742_t